MRSVVKSHDLKHVYFNEMNTFEVTSSTGGGVDLKNTVSLAKECQDLIVKAAGLTKIREDVLLPILYYLANEAEEKLTLNSDPIKLTWEILRQGSFMCELINQVQPGVITETYLPVPPITPGHFKDINSRQNISAFIRACRDMFFMKDDEIFSVGDLYKEDFITFGKALKLCQFYLGNKIRVSTRNSISLRLDELDEDDAKLFFIQEAIIQEEGEEASEEDKKKSRKRALLIQELVASERVYVNDLTKLNQYSEAVKSSHVISQPLINAIFSNLKALVNFQKKFLIQLESEVSKKSNMDLGTLFQVNETEFQVYETFCTNHKNSMETLREQLANLQKQPDLIEGLGDLSGYLIKPVQRITRYHLFFRDLLKESKKQRYDDIPKLQTAIQVIKRITTSINEKQREAENALIAEEFYERFPTGKITLEKTGKLVLYDSSMKMRLGDNLKNYRIYLFEKRIVMCSERDKFGPFWMKNQLASNTIKSVALKDSGLSAEPFEIEVSCQDEEKVANWSLLLRTEQHAALWSKYIRVVAGLPADTSKEEAEEVIEIVPVEETKMEPTSHSEPAMQKEYFWISEFMDEKYFISTESIPTLVDLKT